MFVSGWRIVSRIVNPNINLARNDKLYIRDEMVPAFSVDLWVHTKCYIDDSRLDTNYFINDLKWYKLLTVFFGLLYHWFQYIWVYNFAWIEEMPGYSNVLAVYTSPYLFFFFFQCASSLLVHINVTVRTAKQENTLKPNLQWTICYWTRNTT